MIVRTSQDVALIGCCDCQPPDCDEPRKICESMTHTSYCSDDDFTDAHNEWDRINDAHNSWMVDHYLWTVAHAAWVTAHAAWVTEHAAWVTEHAAWVTAHAAWETAYDEWYNDEYIPWFDCMAEHYEDPEFCGDEPLAPEEPPEPPEPIEPVEPIEPIEPPEAGTEPEPPEGYGDVFHECYGPFAEPSVDPDARIPTIYRTLENDFSGYDQKEGDYYLLVGLGSSEHLNHRNYSGSSITDTATANSPSGGSCGTTSITPSMGGDSYTWTDDPVEYECTDSERTITAVSHTAFGTVPLSLVGCPGPWGTSTTEAWDVTRTHTIVYRLGGGIQPDDLTTRAASNLATRYDWPLTGAGSYCTAISAIGDWPTPRDLYVESEAHVEWEADHAAWVAGGEVGPEPEEPDNLHWLGCAEYPDSNHALPTSASATARKVRYKIGIPTEWSDFEGRHDEWETEHALWVAADPDTRGPEPLEPIERTTYECQWVEGFFSKEWTEWRAAKDDFDLQTILHEVWEDCEAVTPGGCFDEPEIPADPGEEPDRPSIVEERSWTYNGTDEFSDWFEMAAPAIEGEVRVVNMLVKCYQSARLGVKPTAHGEVFEFDEN